MIADSLLIVLCKSHNFGSRYCKQFVNHTLLYKSHNFGGRYCGQFVNHTPRLRLELRSEASEAPRISATLSGQYVKKRMRRLFYFALFFLNKTRLFFFKQPPSNSVPTETRTQVESSAGFQDIHYPIRTRRRTKWHIYHINLILKSHDYVFKKRLKRE